MRNTQRFILTIVLLLVAFMATSAVAFQQPDLYSTFTPSVTLGPVNPIAGNTARTGAWVNRSQYASVAVLVHTGHVVEATTARRYAVLQDSLAGVSTVTAVDSVLIDTVDNVVAKLRYTGIKTAVRILIRAGTGSGDSAYTAATVLLGNARRRS